MNISLYYPAEATQWQLFGANEEKGLNLYYDMENLKYPVKGLVTVWVKAVPQNEQGRKELLREKARNAGPGYDNIGHRLSLYELKCGEKKYRITHMVDYRPDGGVIHNSDIKNAPWKAVPPDSMEGFLYMEVACP